MYRTVIKRLLDVLFALIALPFVLVAALILKPIMYAITATTERRNNKRMIAAPILKLFFLFLLNRFLKSFLLS